MTNFRHGSYVAALQIIRRCKSYSQISSLRSRCSQKNRRELLERAGFGCNCCYHSNKGKNFVAPFLGSNASSPALLFLLSFLPDPPFEFLPGACRIGQSPPSPRHRDHHPSAIDAIAPWPWLRPIDPSRLAYRSVPSTRCARETRDASSPFRHCLAPQSAFYYEDRRPAANANPYAIAKEITEAIREA